MKKESPEKWVEDGAFRMFSEKSPILGWSMFLVMIVGCLAAFITGLFFQKEIKTITENDKYAIFLIAAVVIYAILLASIQNWIRSALYKKVSKSLKWQKMYLQSKIDEYEVYRLNIPILIASIQEEAAKKMEEASKNLEAMFEKRNQAELILQQL